MKKNNFIFLAFAGITIFTACKKQRSCQCSSTSGTFTAISVEPITKKTTKKEAKEICNHAEKQITKYHIGYEVTTVECTIK